MSEVPTEPKVRGVLMRYKVMAFVTGTMLLLLCAVTLLKYTVLSGNEGFDSFATVVGIVHGWIFMVYVFTCAHLWVVKRWKLGRLITMALGGVVPFLSFVVEARVEAQVLGTGVVRRGCGVTTAHRPVLVVDCGAQYAQLIARRVREAHVYSEIVPHSMSAAQMLERNPAAVILSGGPSSVYEPGAPVIDPALFDSGIPVMGICYGFQAMAAALGGTVAQTGVREYGRTTATVSDAGTQLAGSPAEQQVWMSHGDSVLTAPEGFTVLATTDVAPVAAFENVERRMSGVQWHPEVKHSPLGQAAIENFLYRIAGLEPRLDQRQRDRGAGRVDPRAGGRRARHLRALRRR